MGPPNRVQGRSQSKAASDSRVPAWRVGTQIIFQLMGVLFFFVFLTIFLAFSTIFLAFPTIFQHFPSIFKPLSTISPAVSGVPRAQAERCQECLWIQRTEIQLEALPRRHAAPSLRIFRTGAEKTHIFRGFSGGSGLKKRGVRTVCKGNVKAFDFIDHLDLSLWHWSYPQTRPSPAPENCLQFLRLELPTLSEPQFNTYCGVA